MATMSGEIYDAFVEAGASPEKARKAAEAVAHMERDSSARQSDVTALKSDIDQRFTKVDGELTLLKWMVGVNTAAVIAVLLKLLFP